MTTARKPAVAGLFYSSDPNELRSEVADLLDSAVTVADPNIVVKAVISPHAGYVYSGSVAAVAIANLAAKGKTWIKRLIVMGPSHHVAFHGIAQSTASEFLTPLGSLPIATEARGQLESFPFVHYLDKAHEQEHSVEVQLPFIQIALPNVSVIPLVVGDARPEEVSSLLDSIVTRDSTAVVVSSDLSHYLEYSLAKQTDANTAFLIESLQFDRLHSNQACGAYPVKGLLRYAKDKGLKGLTVKLTNSGETVGPPDRVVGYGAFVFY